MRDGKSALYGFGAIILLGLGLFAMGRGGLLGFLGKAALWVLGLSAVLILAVVALVVFLAMRPSSRKGDRASGTSTRARTGHTKTMDDDDRAALAKGRRELTALRQLFNRVEDGRIREAGSQVCGQVDKLFTTLREKPEAIPKARQFFNYYLPTLGKILDKYTEMERGGATDADITEKVLHHLEDIRTAAERQHRNLFEADILDLTVEMQVMTMICRREGLLTDEDLSLASDAVATPADSRGSESEEDGETITLSM